MGMFKWLWKEEKALFVIILVQTLVYTLASVGVVLVIVHFVQKYW